MSGYYTERLFGLYSRPQNREAAHAYALERARNPNKGSVFDRQTRWFRNWLPDRMLMWVIKWSGRDGLLFFGDEGKIVGHVFWHRRKDNYLHMFNVGVIPECQGRGMMTTMLADHFIPYAHSVPGVIGVRVGAGGKGAANQAMTRFNHDRVVRFCEKLVRHEVPLCQGITLVSKGNYFFLFPDKVAVDVSKR